MAAFNLFDHEEKVLEDGLNLTLRLEAESAPKDLRDGVSSLVNAYRKSTREQRRLVRVSDRLQEQLSAVNQELQRRREEAENALLRLKEAQDSLIQAEKLASLGSLVAGVAHEINTPVGIALASASHLADSTQDTRRLFEDGVIKKSDFRDYIATATDATALILANCERAAQLINGFKQVAVDQTSSERRRFALKGYIQEVLLSLSPKLRQMQIEVELDCPSDLELDGFPGALSQVLTNFVMNSIIHGFEDRRGGQITIAAKKLEDDIVEIKYSDDGNGMTSDIKNRIFDPFFTTKRGSGGNGLGLHIVFNIVTGSLKGQIAVESELGQGTSFTLLFPRVAPRDSDWA
jgi:signal transduction histidine kinase